jgi:hypothetical protein
MLRPYFLYHRELLGELGRAVRTMKADKQIFRFFMTPPSL